MHGSGAQRGIKGDVVGFFACRNSTNIAPTLAICDRRGAPPACLRVILSSWVLSLRVWNSSCGRTF
jgi:hypothetical protein